MPTPTPRTPTPRLPTVDWEAVGLVTERVIAAELEAYRAHLPGVPRDAIRRRVLDRLGADVANRPGDPHRDERYFDVCLRALDRALDAYYGPGPAP